MVEPGDEAVEAQVARELGDLLDPVLGRAAQPAVAVADHAVEVRHAPDRRRVAARLARRLVDRVLLRRHLLERQPRQRGHPAVGEPPDGPDHPRPVGAEPDADVVRRIRPAVAAAHLVVLALDGDPALAGPDAADDLDRLDQRVDRLRPRPHRPAPGADALPERARAEPELDPAAAQPVERGRGLREHARVAQRQVGDVGEEAHALGAPGEVGDQRPGVEVAALVRVVLDADEVEAEPVGQQHLLDHRVLLGSQRDREDAEEGLHDGSVPSTRVRAPSAVDLDLPDRRLGLHAVDQRAGGVERLAAVRRRGGHDHARLAQRHGADPVLQRHRGASVGRRDLLPDRPQLLGGHLHVGLVVELGHLARDALEEHDRAGGGIAHGGGEGRRGRAGRRSPARGGRRPRRPTPAAPARPRRRRSRPTPRPRTRG